jgi:single-strand DNA-binding protein
MNLNKVYLIGRLTQDPEVRITPTGQNVASFGLATSRIWNDQNGQKQEQTEFHNIVVWRRLAEIAAQYLKKGQLLMVEGRLQTRNWVGQDGVKRYKTEVVAENFQMGPKAFSSGGGQSNFAPRPSNAPAASVAGPAESKEEEIPVIQVEEPSFGSETSGLETPVSGEEEVVPF